MVLVILVNVLLFRTQERCVVLGDMWMWDKKKLDGKVRERLSQAYNALEQHEKGSEWN